MNYILKQFDNDLLYFSMNNTNDGLQVHINSVNEKMKNQIPLDLEVDDNLSLIHILLLLKMNCKVNLVAKI